MSWPMVALLDAVEDVTAGNRKLPKTSYQSTGCLPIVDQGVKPVAGWTNNTDSSVRSVGPHIVFGDHTRAIKFVDYPFAIGADGVKVLRARRSFEPRFVYHFLRANPIPAAGYSRHFKYLKQLKIPLPPLDEQRRIAAVLGRAESTELRFRRILQLYEDLISVHIGRFMERIPRGESEAAPLREVAQFVRGVTFSPEDVLPSPTDTSVEVYRTKNVQKALDLSDVWSIDASHVSKSDQYLRVHDILVSTANSWNLVGRCAPVLKLERPAVIGGFVTALRATSDAVDARYLYRWFSNPSTQADVRNCANRTTNISNLSLKRCEQLVVPIPLMRKQQRLLSDIARIEALKGTTFRRSERYADAVSSLQQRAFRGRL